MNKYTLEDRVMIMYSQSKACECESCGQMTYTQEEKILTPGTIIEVREDKEGYSYVVNNMGDYKQTKYIFRESDIKRLA